MARLIGGEMCNCRFLAVALVFIAFCGLVGAQCDCGRKVTRCSSQHSEGDGYCAREVYNLVGRQVSTTQDVMYKTSYNTKCGSFGWERCKKTRYRTRSTTVYVTAYTTEMKCSLDCCTGYRGSAPICEPICVPECSNGGECRSPNSCTCKRGWKGDSCTIAICSNNCQNGGRCTAPNTCTCATGWSGSTCTKAICEQSCENGGTCTSPGVCGCASGWTGPLCTEPVCSAGCSNGGTCTAPNTCSCTAQWTGSTCEVDVNECLMGTDNCEQACSNRPGSFTCGCKSGFRLHSNEYQCDNIDECSGGTSDCSQECFDTEGSYTCGCRSGYTSSISDPTACEDEDECQNNPCQHTCINNVGSFQCECRDGYRLQDSTKCADIDECTETKPCAQNCANNVGSYTCSCRDGYTLDQDGLTCNDINECETGDNECSQSCQNTDGGHYCYCNSGFLLADDGQTCEEFDLSSAMNTPSVPSNLNFIETIEDGLNKCIEGSICTCIHDLFTTLADEGFTQDTLVTTGRSFSLIFSTENQQSISDLILAIFGSDSSIALPIVANIRELAYNCTNHEFTVETFQAGGELEIFPNIMTLSMVNLRVSISSVWSSPQLESLLVIGSFGFGTVVIDTQVETNDPDVWTFEGSLSSGTEVNIIELISSAISVDIPSEPLGNLLTITDLTITGLLDIEANFEYLLVLQGDVHISDWYNEDVCIIITQSLNKAGRLSPQLGFLSGCMKPNAMSFTTLIDKIAGVDLSGFGFFNNFELPSFHIVYSTASFEVNLPHLSMIGFSDLEFALDTNYSGFRFIFEFHLERLNIFKSWVFHRGTGPVAFRPVSFDDLDGFTLSDMVSTLSSVLTLPEVEIFSINLDGLLMVDMSLDLDLKVVDLSINVPEDITVFIDTFLLRGLNIDFRIDLNGGVSFRTLNIDGELQLSQTVFMVSMGYDDGEYDLSACASNFNGGFFGIANSLGTSFANSIAVKTFGFGDIGLFDPCFSIKFRAGMYPEYMCFSADLFKGDFADVGISACVTEEKKWVFGFEVREFVIAQLLTEMIGSSGRQVAFFNQELYTALMVASTQVDNLPLTGVLLDQVDNIIDGSTLIAHSQWPEGCNADPFCNVARSLIGENLEISLLLQIYNNELVTVEATVENFMMGDFTLSAASFQMMFAPGLFSLAIAAEMAINDPPITLIGAFRLRFPQSIVSMELAMEGCWPDAFGISILDMCDFFISVSILPGSPLPGVSFGVTVKIGEENCYILEATGFFGINPNDAMDNYFYVDVGPLTFQRVVDLFCQDLELPNFLADSGFPEGFMASYASRIIVLKHADLIIQPGFYFNGTLNIFGLVVESEMLLDAPDLIDVYARLSPLSLGGGLLKIYESRDHPERGPFLHVIVVSNPARFAAAAAGYVSVLGIEVETDLIISDAGYQIYLFGSIYGVLEAELLVKAAVGNIIDASYRVAGNISSSVLETVENAVSDIIDESADEADEALVGAQDTVLEAEEDFDKAVADLEEAQEDLDDVQSEVRSLRSELSDLDSKLCNRRKCSQVCVPLLCSCGCSKRVLGKCVIPCLKFDDCCYKITDPVCQGYNAACRLQNSVLKAAIVVAEAALLVVQKALEAAEEVVHSFERIVDETRFVLDASVAALEALRAFLSVGVAALDAINEYLLTGLIDIKRIGFDVEIAAFSHGSLSVSIEVSFLKDDPVSLATTLPIYNPIALAVELAEEIVPGLGRRKRHASHSKDKVMMLARHFKQTGSIYPSMAHL